MDGNGGGDGRLRVAGEGDRSSALPEADTWYIDPVHSTIGFTAGMQELVRIRGRFGKVSGVVWVGEKVEESSANVTIETASIDTGIQRRDNHLRSPEFLDVERHPTMNWHGYRTEPTADRGVWVFHGDLTVKGVKVYTPLTGRFLGQRPYPFGDAVLASFTGSARLDRFDFGLDAMPPVPGAKLFIGRGVDVHLDVAMINSDIRFFTKRFLSDRRVPGDEL
ncbi:polyisoprenoid-binding protein YceI [Spinactinospora alkalitolerans]|uniref:Polyisoprenoid-binding protein YceI n=1 Tax=Spinactinospora alkalitolerans TaxID=687207 RepID=A0A852TT84_9ACTN|nr:YceI family protein [Spinactinospora alkalitolerans]NYE45963.1 polyisoprenoid-binding protein YceI [Spinactinospora alkalitolerans]